METQTVQQSPYQIEGEFLGFLPNSSGKLKHIQVQVGKRILPIKLAKELRKNLSQELIEGDILAVFLEPMSSELSSKLKLKSNHVEILHRNNSQSPISQPKSVLTSTNKTKGKTGKILLCSKSSCSKRGGKQLYRALTEALEQLGLQKQVKIELTGCQKQCKKAPSLVLTPGKVKHTYVNPDDLVSLLKAHYL